MDKTDMEYNDVYKKWILATEFNEEE